MKALIAILFSLFFLLTTMQEATFLLLYKLNEKSITEKYCVNKNVKNSCCKGKCHLNKTIAKSENNNNPFSVLNLKVREVEIFFQHFFKTHEITLSSYLATSQYKIINANKLQEGITALLFKPPIVLG